MTAYKLHCFKESGNSYKVALALRIAGIPWEKVDVDYFQGATRQPGWRASVNEMGEVPVLEGDGVKRTQSGAILLHLAQQHDALRVEDSEQAEVLRWILFDNHKFTANLASYRWLRCFAKPQPHDAVLDFMRSRAAAGLDIVNQHLSDREYIVGRRLTVADISLAGYVFYPAGELGFDFANDYPHLDAWMGRIAGNPGWLAPYEMLA